MGHEVTPGLQGKFYLKTNGSPQYGLGQGGIEVSKDSCTSSSSTSLTTQLINFVKNVFS